ncbi:VOC family protein [Microbacterium oryzae]|nr:VOC family protein [Microbacterium oryzae]MDN3311672.1 VOC family protein [Microbacterium oryzae]
MRAMSITIHSSFLPQTDPEAALAFYRDALGFEVRGDVGYQGLRWLTVGPVDQPDTNIVLYPPGAETGITAEERETVLEMMAKGTFASLLLATADVDAEFARLEALGVDIVQEPMDQPYGVRDAALRDPSGNLVRLQQRP